MSLSLQYSCPDCGRTADQPAAPSCAHGAEAHCDPRQADETTAVSSELTRQIVNGQRPRG